MSGEMHSGRAREKASASTESLYSWGRFPQAPQRAKRINWQHEVPQQLASTVAEAAQTLAYGSGRSYGDSCLAASNQVLDMRGLDRFIEVDWSQGIVEAEAGVLLADITELAVPQGWFLAVTPGTQFVTLGGAVANDVHGKNHHQVGCFGRFVRSFTLFRLGAVITCSTEENTELFEATLGGLGLTGIILSVSIQLTPIHSSLMDVTNQRFDTIEEFFELSAAHDAKHSYAVAWVDCLAKAKQLGRGVYSWADHSEQGALRVLAAKKRKMPVTPPFSLVNKLTLNLLNHSYWHRYTSEGAHEISDYQRFFYPLDGLQNWNRAYGRRGFQQFQCVLPERMAKEVLTELLAVIAESEQGSFLAVLKRCGSLPSPGLLSFPMPGISLALDFPQHANLWLLFNRLDAMVHEAGGRLYPAKDAHMSASHFRMAYPNWEALERLRDPALLSQFWQRVMR